MPPTRFQLHCANWSNGCGSEYCEGARKVFFRGDIPCDILFIGEAPGKSENSAGIPFHPGAPAGKLLMHIVKRSVPTTRPHKIEPAGYEGELAWCPVCKKGEVELSEPCLPYRIGYTNIVSCIPRDPDSTEKLTEPSLDQVSSCKPRLEEIISIANPRLIIAVGQVAKAALTRGYMASTKLPQNCAVAHIHHPAFILRQTTAFQGLEVQRCCITIKEAIHALEHPAPATKPKAPTQPSNYGIVSPDDEIPF